tara:strand:+ start:653 stop:1648 length:996 start_codon:yes stop_codon:yes gene_type:complete
MGCHKLTYHDKERALEVNPFFIERGLEKKSGAKKNRVRAYRYGFNGQERDDEIAGAGNSMTAMFWQYDTRLGRRWNLDPKPNPSISSYATFANNPIWFNDPFGDTTSYYDVADNSYLGTINNPGERTSVKITSERFRIATTLATSDPSSSFYGYKSNQTKAQGLVNDIEWKAKRDEIISGNSNIIAFETGVRMEYSGTIKSNRNGKYAMGKLNTYISFDDNTEVMINSISASSGPFGDGYIPTGSWVVGGREGFYTWGRSGAGFTRNGVYFKFDIVDPDGRAIHPDGNVFGTRGCIGLIGSANQLLIWKKTIKVMYDRHGPNIDLNVKDYK